MPNEPYSDLFPNADVAMRIWKSGNAQEYIPAWLKEVINRRNCNQPFDDNGYMWNGSLGEDAFRVIPELWGEDRIFEGAIVFRRFYYTSKTGLPRVIVTVSDVNDYSDTSFVIGEWWKRKVSISTTRVVPVVNVLDALWNIKDVYPGHELEGKISGEQAAALVRSIIRATAQVLDGTAVPQTSFDENDHQYDVLRLVEELKRRKETGEPMGSFDELLVHAKIDDKMKEIG